MGTKNHGGQEDRPEGHGTTRQMIQPAKESIDDRLCALPTMDERQQGTLEQTSVNTDEGTPKTGGGSLTPQPLGHRPQGADNADSGTRRQEPTLEDVDSLMDKEVTQAAHARGKNDLSLIHI